MQTLAQKWFEQGEQQGEKIGIQKGEKIGYRKGQLNEILKGIELGLELKFGVDGLSMLPEIRKIKDIDGLHAIRVGIRVVKTQAELRKIYYRSDS